MIYFSIKSDRKFMESYYILAKKFLSNKNRVFSGGTIEDIERHTVAMNNLREDLARGLPRAKRLASIFQIPVVALDPVSKAQYHAFSTIINYDADGFIADAQKIDLLNETIGACYEAERAELFTIVNPIYWFTELVTKILRFPFWVLETAGFKSESFEKSLAGSIVRLIELVLIIAALVYLGFSESELKEVIKRRLDT